MSGMSVDADHLLLRLDDARAQLLHVDGTEAPSAAEDERKVGVGRVGVVPVDGRPARPLLHLLELGCRVVLVFQYEVETQNYNVV